MSFNLRSNGVHGASNRKDTKLMLNLLANTEPGQFVPNKIASRVFAAESLDVGTETTISTAANSFRERIVNATRELGMFDLSKPEEVRRVNACESAAVASAFRVQSGTDGLVRNSDVSGLPAGENTFVMSASHVPNYQGSRSSRLVNAMEAFDVNSRHQSAVYSMAYNYSAPIQSEFSEAIWPLLTLAADQLGFAVVVPRLTIWRGMIHEVSGRIRGGEKIDLVRAGVDPSILSRKKNRVVPVYRAAAADYFVDPAIVTPFDYTEEGENFKTSYLKMGVKIESLMGLSQTDAQLTGGSANQTDSLDNASSIEDVLLNVDGNAIAINIYGHMGANFVFNQQGKPEDRRLNFDTDLLVLGHDAKQVDAAALSGALAVIATRKLNVVLGVTIDGTLNTEYTSSFVRANRLEVVNIFTEAGLRVDPTDPDYIDVADAVANGKIEGYRIRAFKVNANMRERGDMLDSNKFTQLYEVPILSPITYQRPIGSAAEYAKEDYENLITATRFRQEGDCVAAIFETVDRIRQFTKVPFAHTDAPNGLGAGRFSVKPYLADLTADADCIDVEKVVLTTSSEDLVANVQAVLLNRLRDIAYSMWIRSEYRSGLKLHGINPDSVQLVIACDPYIRRYLTEYGDLRTMTEKFKVKVVDTDVKDFRDYVFMTFQVFDDNRNTAPNVMSFGNFVWASESVVSSQMQRGDSNAVETIVQPRYLFVNHCPVAALVRVKGISKVFLENFIKVKNKVV